MAGLGMLSCEVVGIRRGAVSSNGWIGCWYGTGRNNVGAVALT